MSDGGTIRTQYILDLSQLPQAAAQIRGANQGIQQSTDNAVKSWREMEAEIKSLGSVMQKEAADTRAGIQSQAQLAAALGNRKQAIELLESQITKENAETEKGIRLATQITQLENQEAAAIRKTADDTLRLAQARSRAALAAGDKGGALSILQGGISQTSGASPIALANAQAQLNAQLNQGADFATQFGASFRSSILGVIGPAALATAGFSALRGAIDLTEESFKFKAALDSTNLSIRLQLQNFRDVNQALAQGSAFADTYRITQEENAEAIQASIPILRTSSASLFEVEGVLARLSVLKPSQGIQGAAFALAELEGGQSRSLATRFNIPIAKANELRNAIRNGGDAIQVMGQYLDSVGIGMDSLSVRTQGATGKMNALAVETEKFKLALGGQAGGPGEAILDQRIALTANATRVLSGDTATLTNDLLALANAMNPVATAANLVSSSNEFAISKFNELTGSAIPPTFFSINGLTDAWGRWTGAVEQSPGTIPGSQRIKEELQAITRDANAAADAVAAALGAKPLPHLTDTSGPSGVGGAITGLDPDRFTQGSAAVARAIKKAEQEAEEARQKAERLADLQLQNRLIKAKDSASKIAILQGELAKTTDPIERQQIQNQIDQERISAAKSLNSTADKRLKTEESIYDAIQKQRDAMLDIEEFSIKDRQADREAAAKVKSAQNLIRALGGRTDARANDLRGRAQDVIALADVENRKREFELEQKRATAGGTITSAGRLLQSVQGGGGTPQAGATPTPAAPGGAPPSASSNVLTLRLVDSAGRVIAETVEPFIMDALMKGVQAVKVSKGA